jgi:hypothetical protein
LRAKTYVAIVEALKPPISELDKETRQVLDDELSRIGSKPHSAEASRTDHRRGSLDGEESREDLDGELSRIGSKRHSADASGEDHRKGPSEGEESREQLDGELSGSGSRSHAASASGKNPRKRFFEGEESSDDGSDISGKSLDPFKPRKRYWRF